MYKFVDVIDASDGVVLPSEALQINGEYIENLISGYRTLNVSGREALSPELTTFETGTKDGSTIQSRRYPARTILVTYQLITDSPEAFRAAYNQLGRILNVEDARLIFNDEQDKYFIGTPSMIGSVEPGLNSVVGEIEFFCADPFKYSVIEYEATPDLIENHGSTILIDYNGTYKAYPTLITKFYQEYTTNEDGEKVPALGGKEYGSCGYVAFYNEDEKIIQLGDPDEQDEAGYDASQMLMQQEMNSAAVWNSAAQAKWIMNNGAVVSDVTQAGSVGIQPATYIIPVMAETTATVLTATSKAATPYITYKVVAKTSERKATTVKVNVSVTTTVAAGGASITAGAPITLNNTKLYTSSTATSNSGTRSGTYYLWDATVKNGRIRITNSKSNVGKSGEVTGWVNTADLNLASAGLAKGYGLKGAIQINGGSWEYVTLKDVGTTWAGNSSHTATVTVTVKDIVAETSELEDIKFKVERTDEEESKVGRLDETKCQNIPVDEYVAPVVDSYYLAPTSYDTIVGKWHGPAMSYVFPADAAGNYNITNFTLSYSQRMCLGNENKDTEQIGAFQMVLHLGDASYNGRCTVAVRIVKSAAGKSGKLYFRIDNTDVYEGNIDLSYKNKYLGYSEGTVRASRITKSGNTITFDVAGVKKSFTNAKYASMSVGKITFCFEQFDTYKPLSYNGLYWAKFRKDNCDTLANIPNKFAPGDIVQADCKSGEIILNNSPMPALGALGNDWEGFYLTPGLNQIGCAFSDWVMPWASPDMRIRYREVFL